jgi:hypothetical protein
MLHRNTSLSTEGLSTETTTRNVERRMEHMKICTLMLQIQQALLLGMGEALEVFGVLGHDERCFAEQGRITHLSITVLSIFTHCSHWRRRWRAGQNGLSLVLLLRCSRTFGLHVSESVR